MDRSWSIFRLISIVHDLPAIFKKKCAKDISFFYFGFSLLNIIILFFIFFCWYTIFSSPTHLILILLDRIKKRCKYKEQIKMLNLCWFKLIHVQAMKVATTAYTLFMIFFFLYISLTRQREETFDWHKSLDQIMKRLVILELHHIIILC